ncbi:MAG: hypothetical protein GWO07_08050 [Candidatus Dadabacteria bacterium]|nr:hypothetical protein [Candidatus Dadabacteria bacterium]NIS08696.1 hypothetical protein [Candidatus Dadabacteria bacterium]NIV42178.1 hypothetical protein [Candidatus Dadabacteria bacterium]NIX15382.1 hypothetical protein [Candidatus Dadabacteria bacterium]NIY22045.1 hypothetical protein [Candidatus Dadabacteria bacterium]
MILVTGDNTVGLALDSVVEAANRGEIPVLTLITTTPNKGTLLDLGADFYEVGKLQGHLAAKLINGDDPASVPIENVVPEVIVVNKRVLSTLKDPRRLLKEIVENADAVIDENGKEVKNLKK